MPVVCPSLRGRHCEVRVSVSLVSVGFIRPFGSFGVPGGACGVRLVTGVEKFTLEQEETNPTSSSPKNFRPSVRLTELTNEYLSV